MVEDLNYEKDKFPIVVVEKMLENVATIIGNGNISSSNIITILLVFMQTVEKYKDITGEQKKNLVLHVLNSCIEEHTQDSTKVAELKLLVKLTLPTVIDTFIDIDKEKIIIKTKIFCKNLFKCCKNS